ncbi:O-antigen ligase family protein [Patescibacteria group bacterium]|nr:O-antigen ligase family protein [Patescibacteria group bacterium]
MKTSSNEQIRFIVYLFIIFQLLSIIGYYWQTVRAVVFFIIILLTIIACSRKIEYGFLILFFEFLAGHGGHLFEMAGISLRTSLFLIVVGWWLFKQADKYNYKILFTWPKSPILVLYLLLGFLVFNGLVNGLNFNDPVLAIKDVMNYAYLFLVFPIIDILKKNNFKKDFLKLSQGAIIGISFITILIFFFFILDLVEVHDSFYWWWRSVATGKATFTGNNFFRIVSPLHLLILPAFLILLSLLTSPKLKSNKIVFLAIICSLVLLLNFSRAYFLGMIIGMIFLIKNWQWKKWLGFCLIVIIVLILEFTALYAIASKGQALSGLNYFKDRMHTFVSPEDEMSSLTRMIILPNLITQIKQNPVFGQGLGAKVFFDDPITGEIKNTFHLDWGYLEIWLELGIFGLVTYGLILLFIFYYAYKKLKHITSIFEQRFIIGLLAGLVSIAVSTLTGPFLFHPLGLFYLTFTSAYIINTK